VHKNYSEQLYSCFLCVSGEVATAIMLWNILTSLVFVSFNAGVHSLSKKSRNHLKILGAKRGGMQQVPYWGPSDIRRRHWTRFIRHSVLTPEICTPPV